MKNWIKENKLMFAVILGVLALFGIALNEFLFTSDGPDGITGAQAIKQLGKGFWGWMLLASAISGTGVYFLVKYLKKEGGQGVSYSVLFAILIPLMIVLGKACEGKSDEGVTTPKGRPVPSQVDTTRIPAEDLLPKK